MTKAEVEQIKIVIQETIERKVNGKIDKLQSAFEEHIKDDKEWKDSVMPSIEIMKKMQGFSDVGIFIFKWILLLGGVGSIVWGGITWFKRL